MNIYKATLTQHIISFVKFTSGQQQNKRKPLQINQYDAFSLFKQFDCFHPHWNFCATSVSVNI